MLVGTDRGPQGGLPRRSHSPAAAGIFTGGTAAVGEGHGAEDTHAGASLACEKAGEE